MASLTESEARLLTEISGDSLWRNTEALAQWQKLSGTPEERSTVEYLRTRLEEYGLQTNLYSFESLVGWPEEAEVEILSPFRRSLQALAHSLAPSTDPGGLEAEVVYLVDGGAEDFERESVEGKVVLLDGMPSPAKLLLAQTRGAVAAVFANDRLRDMCVSPVWGSATTQTAGLLPRIPVVSVAASDAKELISSIASGPVRLRMRTKSYTGWKTVLLLTGDIRGEVEPEKFVLLSGHHCSWYYGAMDNGAANATMLEVARVLSNHRHESRRSVRVAFWPGHTQGRYSGSTWYFDHFWEDVRDNCVLHVNVDSTGARGAHLYHALSMPETRRLAVGAIQDAIGVDADSERIPRAGDQSFWGCGVSSIFMDLSQVPEEMAVRAGSLFTAAGEPADKKKGGAPWWWHTPDDTMDKIDLEVLQKDTRVYLLSVLRSATDEILPLRFSSTSREILEALERYQSVVGDRFSLDPAMVRARQLSEAAAHLDSLLEEASANPGSSSIARVANDGLMALGRILVPLHFSAVDPFEQDLAVPIPPVPALEPVCRLAGMDMASDEGRHLSTEMTRNLNRVSFSLRQALAVAEETLATLHEQQRKC